MTPRRTVFRVFCDGFFDVAEKPLHLPSKMPICSPASAHTSKNVRQSMQNGSEPKNLHHSALELQFSLQPFQKRSFRCRVVKATIVLHRKRHGFDGLPDPKWPFCMRVVNAIIFFGGKTQCFCSLFVARGPFWCIFHRQNAGMLKLTFTTLR